MFLGHCGEVLETSRSKERRTGPWENKEEMCFSLVCSIWYKAPTFSQFPKPASQKSEYFLTQSLILLHPHHMYRITGVNLFYHRMCSNSLLCSMPAPTSLHQVLFSLSLSPSLSLEDKGSKHFWALSLCQALDLVQGVQGEVRHSLMPSKINSRGEWEGTPKHYSNIYYVPGAELDACGGPGWEKIADR